jgi:replication fork protection complex subunit Tof1/Swi1
VLDTFVIYLESYKSFQDPDQLKRIVSLMHRQAVKTKTESLFFKVSCSASFRSAPTR